MTRAAIHEPAITAFVTEGRELVDRLREAEQLGAKLEKYMAEARSALDLRRLELGAHLAKVRATFPKRGTKEQGWGSYLEAIEVDEATAFRYMKLAEAVNFHGGPVKDKLPTYAELGLDKRIGPEQPEAPPPHDDDIPADPAEDEVVIDRDTWCTPRVWTDALGHVDLDPCANARSHVDAGTTFDLDRRGEDGLERAAKIGRDWRVFINPPYSNVLPWIEAYAHTRFIHLLKVDPSTKWFATLFELTDAIFVPRGTRIEFEAPENVPKEKSGSNQFPHAFFYAREEDASDAIRELCFAPWRTR